MSALCACGAPRRSDQQRCPDCAYEHTRALARRRVMAKRVPPEQLEAALALQDAKRAALAQHRKWLQEQYEKMQRKRAHPKHHEQTYSEGGQHAI